MPRNADLTDLRLERDQIDAVHAACADVDIRDAALLHDMIEGETSVLEKAEALVEAIEAAKADRAHARARADEWRRAAKRHDEDVDGLRTALRVLVSFTGLKTIRTACSTITRSALNPIVRVDDEGALPATCWRAQTTHTVDMDAVRALLERGQPVPGARLETGREMLRVNPRGRDAA
ncbi:MAG: siphovirus Gp157 family protein [Pseudomonadota bacterium]